MSEDEADEEVEKVFHNIDIDGNGFISYNEFITACMDKQLMFQKHKLKNAFKIFDRDNDGFIESNEIKHVLGG